jgi:phage FluMu gp28-like protein
MSTSKRSLDRLRKEQEKLLREVRDAKAEAQLSVPPLFPRLDALPTPPKHWDPQSYQGKPVKFALEVLRFKPTDYQTEFLTDEHKRIVLVWPRQSGKTTTLAARMIWFAAENPRTTSLIVAPGLRQSMIVMDRIHTLLMVVHKTVRREMLSKVQRTVIWFKNGAQIVALPNAPDQLRGYTASNVVADESAFFREDELVFYSVLFPMLQTTQGTLIASSTPWGKDSAFYKFTQDPTFSKRWVKIDKVISAKLTTQEFIDEMQGRTPSERFRREYLAEFVEDELSYFNQNLITQCIDSQLAPITDDWTKQVKAPIGRYFLGVDLGKKVDYSIIAITRWDGKRKVAELVGLVRFPLDTPYASVIGMVKVICDKLQRVEKVIVDQTGVGEYIVEEMKHAGIRSRVEGMMLTVPSKQEILGYMKHLMEIKALSLYYDPDLIAQVNVERYELTKTGQIQFSHPDGTHDDELWALALAIYATRTPDTSFMTICYGAPSSFR